MSSDLAVKATAFLTATGWLTVHPGLCFGMELVHSVHEQRITGAWGVYVLRCSVPKCGVAGNPISLALEGASQAKALRNLICAFQALSSLSLIYPTRCGGVQQRCETRFPFIAVIAYCSCQKAGKSVWWDFAPPSHQSCWQSWLRRGRGRGWGVRKNCIASVGFICMQHNTFMLAFASRLVSGKKVF